MATPSSVLAWRIPGTGEPGGCRLWGHTESDTTEVTQHSIAQQCDPVDLNEKAYISDNFYFDQILVKKKKDENQKDGITDTKDI